MSIKKNSKVLLISILGIITLIGAISGATYAFFAARTLSNEYVQGSSGLDGNSLKLDIVQLSDGVDVMMPLEDSDVQSQVSGTSGKGTCINSDNNTVCKVYSITITNMSKVKMKVTGTLTLIADDMPNIKWAKGTSATTGFPTPSGAYYNKSQTALSDETLQATGFSGDSKTYYVVVWVSEQNAVQSDEGTFVGEVSFKAYTTDGSGNNIEGVTSTFR